jgi:hypothetical protein
MADFTRFLELPGVARNRGALASEFDVFEAQTGLTLPPELRELYALSNGLVVNRGGRLVFHTLEEVANSAYNFEQFGIPRVWGYFPFTDCNDSNPHCVCCDGPAKGYVVCVNHDDIARIEFRSVGSFCAAICRVLEASAGTHEDGGTGPSLWRLPQDFYPDTSDRTHEDVETARRLLAFAGTLEEGSIERADAERWAITLFSANEVAEVARLLDTGDEYRRNEAIAKLSALNSPQAQAAVQQHRQEMREFSRSVVDALRQGGVTVAEVSQDGSPRLEPGHVWLNLPMFFTRRRSQTILADVVQRARELIALNTQGNS